MLGNLPIGNPPNVNIGTVIVYSLLFIQCLYSYWSRTPKQINRTLHLTFIISLFGAINGALFLGSRQFSSFYQLGQLTISSVFFGLFLAPLTWMVGITLFSVVLKQVKNPVQTLLAYILFFFQFALIITYVALSAAATSNRYDVEYIMTLSQAATRVFTGSICLNWGFFPLFLWLVVQFRKSVSKKIMVTLVIFCIMNTISLIFVIATSVKDGNLGSANFLYILFFFGDLIPVLSLYMTTFFWRDVTKLEEQ